MKRTFKGQHVVKTPCKNLPGDTNTSIEEETVLGAEQV